MNNNLHIERFLFPCPEIVDSAYPTIPTKQWNGLEGEILKAQKDIHSILHPYVARMPDGEFYFQIYVSRTSNLKLLKRFIIRKGYRLEELEEEMLYCLCHDHGVLVDRELYRLMVIDIKRHFPEIKFSYYKDLRHGLLHLYYTLHDSGPRELLYKAGLKLHATYLDEIDDYNYLGKTPSEIFDGIPMKLLRALHSDWGIHFLSDKSSREHLTHFYRTHSGDIHDWELSCEQFEYILSCEKGEMEFQMKCLQYIADMECIFFDDYMNYLRHRDAIKRYYDCPLCGSEENMLLHMETANELWYEIEHREELDLKLQERYQYTKCLETEFDGLFVKIPKTVEEFLLEGKALKSCIGTYAKSVAEHDSILAFVRKKMAPDKPYLALEFSMEELVQAKGFSNRDLNPEEEQWLNTYCKKKAIKQPIEEDPFYDIPHWQPTEDTLRELEQLLSEMEIIL